MTYRGPDQTMSTKPEVKAFFDPPTWTLTYVVWDPATRDAVALDPVLDYDPAASRIGTAARPPMARYSVGRASSAGPTRSRPGPPPPG